MKLTLKLSGLALAIGGVLFFTRMAPIFAIIPDDMAFPPETTADIVRLAELAGPRWQLSHFMGLIATSLFVMGYWGHAARLADAGHRLVGSAAAIVATLAFGLFSTALVIDGFFLPATALAYAQGGAGAPSLAEVEAAHARALTFFTPGVFLDVHCRGRFVIQALARFHSFPMARRARHDDSDCRANSISLRRYRPQLG